VRPEVAKLRDDDLARHEGGDELEPVAALREHPVLEPVERRPVDLGRRQPMKLHRAASPCWRPSPWVADD
jgi:hypothetical protein